MKTMAIRLEDDLHTQLSLVATLEGQTVTDIIRAAIQTYIEERKEQLSSKAEAALPEIERDAAARRSALASLFGSASGTATEEPPEPTGEPPAEPRNPRGRRGGAAS
jgi:predicted DNA-binding protein